jgi:protein-S-isoprenylcysteine O-methyltransferase Ste14
MKLTLFDSIPAGSVLFCIVIALLLGRFFPVATVVQPPYRWPGWVVIAIGIILWLTSLWQFMKHRTDPRPSAANAALITSGTFRHSRNPIYLGLLLGVLGVAVLAGAASSFVAPIVFFLLVNTFVVPVEEQKLLARFGDQYERDRRTVRRWI